MWSVNTQSNERVFSYFPTEDKRYDEEFLREVEGLFLRSAEGTLEVGDLYYIDGVCLKDLLANGKKARIDVFD